MRTTGLVLALIAAVTLPAQAQTLRGVILDAETGAPVSLAYVGLLVEGEQMVVAALANSTGNFSLTAPTPGEYFVYINRTGYETLMEGVFELGDGGVFDVRIGLKPSPIPLDSLVVETEAERSPLEVAGFYERATLSRGTFMIREEIESKAVERISDAFRGIPRVEIDITRPLTGIEFNRPPAIIMRRGVDQCNPTLYVDRAMVASGVLDEVRPDEFVSPGDVEAIEVYSRRAEVPVQFDAISDCGVVVIWTRIR